MVCRVTEPGPWQLQAIVSSKPSEQFFPYPLNAVLKVVILLHTVTVMEDVLGAWHEHAF